MAKYFIAAYLATLLTAVGQTLLKVSADRTLAKPLTALYFNPLGLAAYGVLAAATLATLYAYSALPLKFATVVLPCNYLFVGVFSFLVLKERFSRVQWVGALLIVSGIVLFNT